MAWLDDRVIDHPKFIELSDGAFRVWAHGLIYCSRHSTGGSLDAFIRAHKVPKRPSNELIKAGIWDREDDGSTWVHDWQEHNEKRDQTAEERRAQARERQRRHRERVKRQADIVTRDVTQPSRDSHGVTERDSHSRAHARARGGAPEHHVTSHQDTQQHARDAGRDDAALERLTLAGWTKTQLGKLDLEGDLERAIAWLDHAESSSSVRNPGGLAWSGYDSNAWPPDARTDVATGASGTRSSTTVNEYVCPRCGPPGYTTEQALAHHVEQMHENEPRPPLPAEALETLEQLKRNVNGSAEHDVEAEPVVDVTTKRDTDA